MKLPNKVYDWMKWLVVIVLPAAATFYSVLAGVWGFPYADEIVKTVAGIETFLGTVLCISTVNYNKSAE